MIELWLPHNRTCHLVIVCCVECLVHDGVAAKLFAIQWVAEGFFARLSTSHEIPIPLNEAHIFIDSQRMIDRQERQIRILSWQQNQDRYNINQTHADFHPFPFNIWIFREIQPKSTNFHSISTQKFP